MRRHWWARVLATLLALWLSLTVGEPGVVHFCPMHGGVASPDAGGHAGGHGAGHDTAAAQTDATTRRHSTPPGHGHADCTCLGACSLSSFAATLPVGVAALPVLSEYTLAVASHVDRTDERAAPDRLLPFANGPPSAFSAA